MAKQQEAAFRCFICRQAIEVGEPFHLVMVRMPAPSAPGSAPMHFGCEVKTIAGEVAASVVDAVENDGEPVRIHEAGFADGDLRGIFARAIKRAFAEMMKG